MRPPHEDPDREAVVGDGDAGRGAPVGRRVFLGLLALGATGVVFGREVADWMERVLGPITARDGTGLSAFLPVGRFRIYSVTGDLPSRARDKYTLKVHGKVTTPTTFSYADLAAMKPTTLHKDFQCVTGWRVHDVEWKGVKLADVLDRVGVTTEGKALRFTSFDGTYTESLSLAQARRDDVLVAYELDGGQLSSEHGGPVRLYVAPMYGYKSCKWLETIEVTDHVIPGYWEHLGYDVDGWVGRSNGRDDTAT
ncbi:MAG: yedY 3 [Actinomycetia bacterium]|nr:yedY 3 [Actinomycetes bacterium]